MSDVRRHGAAVLIVAIASLLRMGLASWIGPGAPFLLYYPAIMAAGWIGGFGAGLTATLLSALMAWYFLISPSGTFSVVETHSVAQLLLFTLAGILVSALNGALHRSRRRAEEQALFLARQQREILRTEAEAAESEERFRIMADTAPVMIWMAGLDKLCDWFNKPWLEFTGRTMEQELGNGWLEGVHPDDMDRCMETYTTSFDARRSFSMEYRLRRRDGEYRWLLDNGVPRFGPAGTFQGYIGSCVDIHDRRLAEEERARLLIATERALQQAEEASRSKDELLATVSHELRTPLNAMLGWGQLLQTQGLDGEISTRGLKAIVRSARHQERLINDLLDTSRIVSGKMRLCIRPVQPATVVEAALETLRPAAAARQIEIEAVLDPQAGPVPGDPDRLQQVAWNLLANAVKFTPEGGRIEVRLERVDGQVEIRVADTGVGIDPELLPYVFDRFRQLDSSRTRSYGGLGLGLSIVRHLVELHGGTIEARSPGPGQGATFLVRLPLAQAGPVSGPRPPSPPG